MLLGRRKAKLMRVVLGGTTPNQQAPNQQADATSQRPQGSQLPPVPVRRFIGVEVACYTGDEFGPDVRYQQGAPPTHAELSAGLVEEMDADSAIVT